MSIFKAIKEGIITYRQVAEMHEFYLNVLFNHASGAGIVALSEGLITPEQAAAMPNHVYLDALLNDASGAGIAALREGLITPEQVAAMSNHLFVNTLLNDASGTGIAALREGLITPEQVAAMPNHLYLIALFNHASGAGIAALREDLISPEQVAAMPNNRYLDALLNDSSGAGIAALRMGCITLKSASSMSIKDISIFLNKIAIINTAINDGLIALKVTATIHNPDTIMKWIDVVRHPQNKDFVQYILEKHLDLDEIVKNLIAQNQLDYIISNPALFSTRLTNFINKNKNLNENLQKDAYSALKLLAEDTVLLAEETVGHHPIHINDEIISLAGGALNPLHRLELFESMRACYELHPGCMVDSSWTMVDRGTLNGSTDKKEFGLDEAVVPFFKLHENEYKLFVANDNITMQKEMINRLLESYASVKEEARVSVAKRGMFHHANIVEKPDYPNQGPDGKPSL